MIKYWIDPQIWIHEEGDIPKLRRFSDVIWNNNLTQQFLDKLGEDDWILSTAVPYAIFHKVQQISLL